MPSSPATEKIRCPWRSTNAQRDVLITPTGCGITRSRPEFADKCHKSGCPRLSGEEPRPAPPVRAEACPEAPRRVSKPGPKPKPASPVRPEPVEGERDHIAKHDHLIEPVEMVPAEQAAPEGSVCEIAQVATGEGPDLLALLLAADPETLHAVRELAAVEGEEPDRMAAILLNEYVKELLNA